MSGKAAASGLGPWAAAPRRGVPSAEGMPLLLLLFPDPIKMGLWVQVPAGTVGSIEQCWRPQRAGAAATVMG